MKKEEFLTSVTGQVRKYLSLPNEYGKNAQIRVNPALFLVDLLSEKQYLDAIAFSQEVIENAAYAEGDATEGADDFQAQQDPDFYPVSKLIKNDGGFTEPDNEAIEALASNYF